MTTKDTLIKRYLAISLLALTVIASVVISVLLIQHWEYVAMLEKQGLIGLFIIAVLAGSPIPVPTPNIILTFTMGSIFNPLLVALVSSFGNAVGNALIYLTGRGGLAFFRNLGINKKPDDAEPSRMEKFFNKVGMVKLREFARKHVLTAVFILGMYPNPLLMTIVMGMGANRYNFWKFFLVCWAGKMVESSILSYLGYFGLRSLLRYFGVFDIPL